MEEKNLQNIFPGSIEDNFSKLKDADWVVEAVVERIDIKKTLYSKIDTLRKAGALISSNTSSIPLKVLTEDMSDEMEDLSDDLSGLKTQTNKKLRELNQKINSISEDLDKIDMEDFIKDYKKKE